MIFIAALRHNRVDRPFVLDGPVNGEAFRGYVEQALALTLQPGDLPAAGRWGVMDNLASHKGQAVQKAIRNAKARLLCLPPYSPDLKPIEQGRAKLKETLNESIGSAELAERPCFKINDLRHCQIIRFGAAHPYAARNL